MTNHEKEKLFYLGMAVSGLLSIFCFGVVIMLMVLGV